MPSPSKRALNAPASPIRKLTPFADAAKARGIKVHHLNIGQPDIATPVQMSDAYRRFDDEVLAYAPSDGFLPYRQRLAGYYTEVSREGGGGPVRAEDIVITVGGSEALLFAVAIACDPGDEILVCEPYYTNYAAFGHILAVGVRAVTTSSADGFRIHPDAVAAAVGPRTRAIVIPTPGNPTGVVLSRDELEAIAAICRKNDLYFVCDEVYREFVYDLAPGARAPSSLSLADFDDYAIVVDSVSKRYSACGARIGALVTRNPASRASALRFAQSRLSPPTVDQYAAMAALDTPAAYFKEVNAEYRARRDVLVAGLRGIGVECRTPEGAFYLVARLPVKDTDRFCQYLLEDFSFEGETVMLAPASGFYATPGLGKDEARVAYVLDSERLRRSVAILGHALTAYKAIEG
jgi:aspartate aminotransferase